jgi:hypothetical protein
MAASLFTLFVFFAVALFVAPLNVFASICIALMSVCAFAIGERFDTAQKVLQQPSEATGD